LQPAFQKTGYDESTIGNGLPTKPHDIGRAGCLIFLGLRECRPGGHDQCSQNKYELFHLFLPFVLGSQATTMAIVPLSIILLVVEKLPNKV
jgi:hypothetical protein